MKTLHHNESGIVAIVVTLIIMLILSITTIGMAQLAHREQRQALDKQLSLQAFYAAESGINDVLRFHPVVNGKSNFSADDCSQTPTINSQIKSNKLTLDSELATVLGTGVTTSYTCALVTPDPSSLEYAQVSPDKAVVANMSAITNAQPFNTLVVGWEDYQSGVQFRGPPTSNCTDLDIGSSWNSAPLLKIDITDLQQGTGNYDRTTLTNKTSTYYLYPCHGVDCGSSPCLGGPDLQKPVFNPSVPTSGSIIMGDCDATQPAHTWSKNQPLRCNVNFDLSGNPTMQLLVRIKPLYGTARISILALAPNDNPDHISDVQTVIDVTGQSSDVARRQQVRIGNAVPYLYGLESLNAVCKRLVVGPNFAATANPGGINSNSGNPPGFPAVDKDTSICDPTQP